MIFEFETNDFSIFSRGSNGGDGTEQRLWLNVLKNYEWKS